MYNNGFDRVDLYKSIIELSADAITTSNLDGIIKFVSPKTLELHGFDSPEELVGKPAFELIAKDQWGLAEAGLQEALSSGYVRDLVYTMIRKDGSTFIGELNAILLRDKEGKPVGFMATTRDITKKVETERAVVESENKYRTLFNNPTESIFVHDFEGQFVDVNQAACDRLQYTKEELLTKNLRDIDSEDSSKLVPERMELLRREGAAIFNVDHISKDGTIIPEQVSARVFKYNGSDLIISISRDLSTYRKLEQQLQHAQKMELVGRLASGVAHSFNNLLTIIKGFATVILAQNGNVPYREELKEIESAASKAAIVVKQLLVFSRKQEMKLSEIDVNELIMNLSKMLSTLTGSKVKIVFDLEPDLYKIRADAVQLEQVLINLTANAKDAMTDGGKLIFKTKSTKLIRNGHPVVDVPSGDYVQISVTDEGCGMSKKVLEHLFEPFFTTKEPGKGTGLGLSTAYGIVKQSGGYIFADSEVGKGTTFNLYFPKI